MWKSDGASREARRQAAAGGATGRRALRGYEGLTETPPQNSQRVLLAKRRTALMARRREPGGPAAELCALPQRDTGDARVGGAMGTSRPTAKPHEGCEGRGEGRGEGAREAWPRGAGVWNGGRILRV